VTNWKNKLMVYAAEKIADGREPWTEQALCYLALSEVCADG